jgi:hypothetical protein
MTVVVERAVVAVVRLEAATLEEADAAFADLRSRVSFTLPKLRFGPARIVRRLVHVYGVDVALEDGTLRLGRLY